MDATLARPFTVRLAACAADLRAAQRLRYDVFVQELGGGGPMVDHTARLETDRFDPHCRHLLLIDPDRPENRGVIGVYRVMDAEGAAAAEGFYGATEYDLAPLLGSGRRLLELGRSCVHPAYRGGAALPALWSGLARHVEAMGTEILFGVASFHGTDPDALAPMLAILHHRYLAPPALRVRVRPGSAVAMDRMPEAAIDRVGAMRRMPALIKAYLRLGGVVGEGAFIDHAFNTTDVCLILDTARMNARATALYRGGAA